MVCPFLNIDQLSYRHQAGPLFNNLNLTLKPQDLLIVTGANGSGKTTLLRLLAGLTDPSSGEIRWGNIRISNLGHEYTQQVHYLAHSNGIRLELSVRENILLMQQLENNKIDFSSAVQQLHLENHLHMLAGILSAGQKRRLALLKLFLYEKPLWILDEPFTALDAETQQLFCDRLQLHLQKGGIAILSTHHLPKMTHSATHNLRLGL